MSLGVDYLDRFVGAGVGAAFAVLVVEKTLLGIGGDAGVETAVLAEENINEVHGYIMGAGN